MSAGTVDQLIAVSVADGTALTAANTATSCIPTAARATLRPGFFDAAGKSIRITALGKISSAITTPGTARFDVRLGTVATPIIVWDGLAILLDTVAAHTNVAFALEILLTCRSVGAGVAAKLVGCGKFSSEDVLGVLATAPKAIVAMLPWNSAPGALGTGFDSTIANTLDLFFTQTEATGSLTVQQYFVEELN